MYVFELNTPLLSTAQLPAEHDHAVSAPQVDEQAGKLIVGLAQTQEEIRQAQMLRYDVFTSEYGAKIGNAQGIDEDEFDAHCDHLIIKCETSDQVIGTYRILKPQNARVIGRYYAEQEFELSGLNAIRHDLVEFGRSCVHANYRSGGAILLLWTGLAEYLRRTGHRYVLGCASVSLRDNGASAAAVHALTQQHIEQADLWVRPRVSCPIEHFQSHGQEKIPPLIKGYLRLGAKVCGLPAWDPDFHAADFPMLLDVQQMNRRYKKHFGL